MRFLHFLPILALLMMSGCGATQTVEPTSGASGRLATCNVEIVFGRKFDTKTFDIPCSASNDSTVISILERSHNMSEIKLQSTGSGETAFVVAIDDVKNEGASGDNWVYYVNDQLGDRGSGVYEIVPGDKIRWSFGKYEPEKARK